MSHRVIVKNLDFNCVTARALLNIFYNEGFHALTLQDVLINRSGTNHPGKFCVAFVTLRSSHEVDDAISKLDNRVLFGASTKPVKVDKALPRLSSLRPWDFHRMPDCREKDIYKERKEKKDKKEKKKKGRDYLYLMMAMPFTMMLRQWMLLQTNMQKCPVLQRALHLRAGLLKVILHG